MHQVQIVLFSQKIKSDILCFCAPNSNVLFSQKSNLISCASVHKIQMFCSYKRSNPISCASVHQIQMFCLFSKGQIQYPVLLCTKFKCSVFSLWVKFKFPVLSLCTAVSRLSFNLLLCSLTCITVSRPLSNVLCLLNYTTVSRLSSNYFVLAKLHHSLPTLL